MQPNNIVKYTSTPQTLTNLGITLSPDQYNFICHGVRVAEVETFSGVEKAKIAYLWVPTEYLEVIE